jgi:hypothetical protein
METIVEIRGRASMACAAPPTVQRLVYSSGSPGEAGPPVARRAIDFPRFLAVVFALVWTAERPDPEGTPVAACLYLTPLDAAARPAGASVRLDTAPDDGAPVPVEHVRMVLTSTAAYVLWRRAGDLSIVRVDGWW